MATVRGGRGSGRRGSEATREALMAAAAELFARYGYGGTTVEAIARRARANKAMISYHFGGKEGLYEQILVVGLRRASERLQALLDSPGRADELLAGFVEMFATLAAERPHFPGMVLREAISGGRHVGKRILPLFVGLFVRVREIIDRGVREGTFRPVDPLSTHLALIGSLVFFFATEPMRSRIIEEGRLPVAGPPSAVGYVRNLSEIVVRGLAAERIGGRAPGARRP